MNSCTAKNIIIFWFNIKKYLYVIQYQAAVISRQESHPVINNTSPALVAQALSGTENIFLEKHFIIRLNLGFFVFLYLSKLVSSCWNIQWKTFNFHGERVLFSWVKDICSLFVLNNIPTFFLFSTKLIGEHSGRGHYKLKVHKFCC